PLVAHLADGGIDLLGRSRHVAARLLVGVKAREELDDPFPLRRSHGADGQFDRPGGEVDRLVDLDRAIGDDFALEDNGFRGHGGSPGDGSVPFYSITSDVAPAGCAAGVTTGRGPTILCLRPAGRGGTPEGAQRAKVGPTRPWSVPPRRAAAGGN